MGQNHSCAEGLCSFSSCTTPPAGVIKGGILCRCLMCVHELPPENGAESNKTIEALTAELSKLKQKQTAASPEPPSTPVRPQPLTTHTPPSTHTSRTL